MPIVLPVDELVRGMTLSESLMDKGRVMLASGKQLNEADLAILRHRYPARMIKVADPILDNLAEFDDDHAEHGVARRVQGKIADCVREVGAGLEKRSVLSGRDFVAMEHTTREVMRYLADNPVTAVLLDRNLTTGTYLADHTAAVFYMSLVVGAAVQGYVAQERMRQTSARDIRAQTVFDLFPLAMGVLVMDLGLFPLSERFHSQDQDLNEYEAEVLRDHPAASADLLPETFPAAARSLVRTHHERMDGSGYPEGLPGERQHVFTRIVRLCDAYHTATSPTAFRQARSPARVVWEMASGPYAHFFDPVLAKLLCQLIQPFPIGAKLRLTDGCYAVLVRYNRTNAFDPWVIVAFDEHGKPIPKQRLAPPKPVSQISDVRLAGFGREDLSYLYTPSHRVEPAEAPEGINELFDACFP